MNTISSLLNFIGKRIEKIQGGTVAGQAVSPGQFLDVSVTFPKAYSIAPTVVACLNSTSTSAEMGLITISANAITTTGFTARIFNGGSSSRSPAFRWVAIP